MSVPVAYSSPRLDGLKTEGLRVAILFTGWNSHIVNPLTTAVLETLRKSGFSDTQLEALRVPGAFELPLAAQWCMDSGFDAVVCLGCIIRGGTPHFEYVSDAATRGILDTGLRFSRPVAFGVLTVDNEQQALERAGGIMGNKGEEAALALLEMLLLKQHLKLG
jgi:6,7-dimethyl-8-ribityllumazine synthase